MDQNELDGHVDSFLFVDRLFDSAILFDLLTNRRIAAFELNFRCTEMQGLALNIGLDNINSVQMHNL